MNLTEKIAIKAENILAGCLSTRQITDSTDHALTTASDLAVVCALLTSTNKEEREQGKELVRTWRRAEISHAKQSTVE